MSSKALVTIQIRVLHLTARLLPTYLASATFLAQIRAAITEFCILPLGSEVVKQHAPLNTVKKPGKPIKDGKTEIPGPVPHSTTPPAEIICDKSPIHS